MVDIAPYRAAQRDEVLALSMRAWAAVMPALRDAVPGFVYAAFCPEGMTMVMVETGGDPGHAPARAAYEGSGFVRWPVARYFRPLDDTAAP